MMAMRGKRLQFQPLTFLLSLVLALVVWAYVDDRRVESKAFEVPLIVEIPEGWESRQALPRSFRVVLQGPKEVMKALLANDLAVVKRVKPPETDVDSQAAQVELRPEDLNLPIGLEVLEQDLRLVEVLLVRLVPDYVRVRANVIGAPEKGFRITSSYPDPNWVRVMVPKGTLKPGDELETYPLDISGTKQSVYRRVGIKPAVLGGRLVTTEADTLVSVVVDPLPVKRTFAKVPIRLLYGLLGLTVNHIEPATVTLELEGPQSVVSTMEELDPIVYADLRELTEPQGTHELRLKVQLPPQVQVKLLKPEEARVTISYKPQKAPPPPVNPAPKAAKSPAIP